MARDYNVGYGKPPCKHQFKKGQSGNPRGRPKGSRNLVSVLNEALDERVVVTINGRRRTLTTGEVMVRKLVADAANGDHRSRETVLRLKAMSEGDAERVGHSDQEDREILSDFERWVRRRQEPEEER